jgi:hypothetical protein
MVEYVGSLDVGGTFLGFDRAAQQDFARFPPK